MRALNEKKKDSGNYSNVLQKKTTRKFRYIFPRVGNKFIYKPEEVTFEVYFRRYESIFEKDCEKYKA